MTANLGFIAAACFVLSGCTAGVSAGPVTPVPFKQVRITGGLWGQRIEVNAKSTLPHVLEQCRTTGRISNFEIAAGRKKGEHQGYFFNDSDVYKIIEGAAYVLHNRKDAKLEKYCDDFIDLVAAAQQPDGYINTHFQIKEKPERRWHNPQHMHQLYCAGHMFEAAVAYYDVTGKRKFLDVALRFADLIDKEFGPEKLLDPPGHQEIEMGLIKLYRVTGEKKYLTLARFFLEQRGNPNRKHIGNWYHQDHVPLLEQTEAVGHAVRAVYGYGGMTDLAIETGDKQYVTALDRFWKNVTTKKMSLTGGIGGGLWEAFDREYFLPNTSVYNETCGAMANVFWNYRMFLLHGDPKYLDVLERTLYNGALGGISLDGKSFFYPNKLEARGARRRPWFNCACCPSNAARFFSSVSKYLYATRGEKLFVNLYASGLAEIKLAGKTVKVAQETDYPWSGKILLRVDPSAVGAFTVAIRIPGWATNRPVPGDLYRNVKQEDTDITLKVNSKPWKFERAGGFVEIERTWTKGDVVELNLPMPVRRVVSNARLLDNAGLVALERGPLVYCVEGLDIGKKTEQLNLRIDPGATFKTEHRKDLLGGVTVITGQALDVSRGDDKVSAVEKKIPLVAIPYYARANRDAASMVVWMLADKSRAILPPKPDIASTSRVTASIEKGSFGALNDQIIPVRSGDASRGVFVWNGKRGTSEWVQYTFKKPGEVSSVEVYWYTRFGTGTKLPESWSLMYRDGDEFKPVEAKGSYGVKPDQFNRVEFKPVKTDALRIVAKAQDKYLETYMPAKNEKPKKMSAGILEWRVK
ncbi:MAG: glycoside hydrolase family 127 protein [Phycisphaerae bacterium]|nr:glycoside hydrolase family 127 protein [Phycisphaerae bacterium]